MSRPTMPAPTVRSDGMLNVLSGLGTRKDVSSATTYRTDPLLTQQTLEAIFSGDGLGRKIVEKPAEESLRRWFEVEGDEGEAICGVLETLNARAAVTDAYVWARLYGGAGIVRLLDDGGNLDEPLRPGSIRRVMGYRVVDRFQLTWSSADLNTDPFSPQYGQPEIYTVSPSNGMPYRVHYSRISIIDGARLPKTIRDYNQGWGASVLQGAWSYLTRVGANYGYTSNVMRDFVQSVLAVNGLTEMLAAGQDDLVRKRINMLDLSRSVLNGMVIDADGESYSKSASSVAGVADLMDRHAEGLCSVVGMPMTELFGRSAGGLNSTGAGETRTWYAVLESERNAKLGHVAESMVRDVYLSKEGPTRGREPADWHVDWKSLYHPTEEEEAAVEKTEAETDKIYWEMGAIDADEVRAKRFPDMQRPVAPVMPPPDGTINADAAPMSLYVSRRVLNVDEVTAWAEAQGFTDVVPDLHVTVCYSRNPVDWMSFSQDWQGTIEIEGGARILEEFNGGAKVLLIKSESLEYRHRAFIEGGASWDFPDYQPHITISYSDAPEDAEPYTGRIVLGPEIFEEVRE